METHCPRVALEDRLNIVKPPPENPQLCLPTPPKELASKAPRKRPAKKHAQESKRKRVKVHQEPPADTEDESEEEDPNLFEESDEESAPSVSMRTRSRAVFRTQSLFASTSASSTRRLTGEYC